MTCGVYSITNAVTGDSYIGRSVSIEARWKRHQWEMIKGRHSNPKMQRLYHQTGVEAFSIAVLEVCPEHFNNVFSEERWIKKMSPTLNISLSDAMKKHWIERKFKKVKGFTIPCS